MCVCVCKIDRRLGGGVVDVLPQWWPNKSARCTKDNATTRHNEHTTAKTRRGREHSNHCSSTRTHTRAGNTATIKCNYFASLCAARSSRRGFVEEWRCDEDEWRCDGQQTYFIRPARKSMRCEYAARVVPCIIRRDTCRAIGMRVCRRRRRRHTKLAKQEYTILMYEMSGSVAGTVCCWMCCGCDVVCRVCASLRLQSGFVSVCVHSKQQAAATAAEASRLCYLVHTFARECERCGATLTNQNVAELPVSPVAVRARRPAETGCRCTEEERCLTGLLLLESPSCFDAMQILHKLPQGWVAVGVCVFRYVWYFYGANSNSARVGDERPEK